MNDRARSLVIALALGLPATVYADTDDEIRTFASSKYTYCDAKLLSGLWKQSLAESKATVGRKLGNGNANVIERALSDARKHARRNPRARCTYAEAGFTYNDAEKLSKIWKRSVADAKALIEDKLLNGDEQTLHALLKRGPVKRDDELAVFLKQDRYSYCDAKLVAALWKKSLAEAKSYIGAKLSTNGTAALERTLTQARANAKRDAAARCSFHDAGFSYDDAVTLAKLWKTTEAEAKARVEEKILGGNERFVRQVVKANGGPIIDEDAVSTFLQQDRYSYCDAKLVSALWKQSVREGKAYIGAKLSTNRTAALDRALVKARANAKRNPAARCSFSDAFTYNDAVKLARMWNTSASEVKVRVEAKILAGGEQFVRQALKTGGADPDDMTVFLRQSKYTYCDAKLIAAMWKQSVEQAKAYIGAKLATKNPAAVNNTLISARVKAVKNPAARCSFHEAGFTYDDAVTLAKLWNTSEGEAKTRVEDKILAGGEAIVRRTLKQR